MHAKINKLLVLVNTVESVPQMCSLKKCSANTEEVYWRTIMQKCDFNKVCCSSIEIELLHGCSPVNLLHIC